ncbi:MAG: hypothetical protein ACLUVV_06190 [Christensenellales bacterium]
MKKNDRIETDAYLRYKDLTRSITSMSDCMIVGLETQHCFFHVYGDGKAFAISRWIPF